MLHRQIVSSAAHDSLASWMTPDNAALRAKMLEHLKVRPPCALSSTVGALWRRYLNLLLNVLACGSTASVLQSVDVVIPPCMTPHSQLQHPKGCLQDEIYKPNYYQSLMDFRQQTLERLQHFAAQHFFKTEDYLKGAPRVAI